MTQRLPHTLSVHQVARSVLGCLREPEKTDLCLIIKWSTQTRKKYLHKTVNSVRKCDVKACNVELALQSGGPVKASKEMTVNLKPAR